MGHLVAKKKTPLERYHEGTLSVEQFLDKLLNGREGDRNRRRIEEKHQKLFTAQPLRK
ncbi:hypothetical protein [Brevibacillus choshinensis]|uniref:hypothetical protein n=1 Tax=Brevibacillus choshinensis TaxID=54911 RepID=UPI000AB6CAC4|nr:hypothetical protein [Brevibacillus choshinensis]